jgi:hypothetical protein
MNLNAHWRYAKYVARHKWYVFRECLRLGVPLHQALLHDWSKFLPGEWLPYARYFYGLPKVGDIVQVACIDNFGGPARVVETRRSDTNRYKVEMLDRNPDAPFWAHDFEVRDLAEAIDAFDRAWNAHQKRQPHHWQFWILIRDTGEAAPLDMPLRFVREMVADWAGAGRTITGKLDVADWYARNAHKMNLHPRNRREAESLLAAHYGFDPKSLPTPSLGTI